jgi:hypothetical protein
MTKPIWFDSWDDRLRERFDPNASRQDHVATYVAYNCALNDTISVAKIAEIVKCRPADVIDAVVSADGDTAFVQPLHDGPRRLM